ncbi:Beta tubulin autoregulation binding site [Echinococcus multilocularis]|uniref:Beta tubulin autoregulation binding site n=1 Tax=Echinococcus multilocularis TaxID=6211 RepID=A0A068XZY9_ECHMU|nr:Beta tubulin autoregulation binding site [Echinococcus multilocularis]
MGPGYYSSNTSTNGEELKPLRGIVQMEVGPSHRDRIKQSEYRKFLKIRTIIFGIVAFVFFVVGLPLVLYSKETRGRVIWAIGLMSLVLGGVCALIFFIYLPIFMRVMATRSETAAYHPRTAEALRDSPYPRQTDIAVPSIADQPSLRPLTAINPNYNPSEDPLLQSGPPATPPLPIEEPPRYDYIQRD